MKHQPSPRLIALTAAFCLLPMLAQAHPGHGESGFIHGAMHPLTGLDHILAMVAVGLWAVQLGGRALWSVPLSFVSVMVIGGALGMAGMPLPFVEPSILASIFILGLLIATATRVPVAAGMLIVGLFALFHGHAHGAEMPSGVGGLAYGAGFALSTALLHCCGVAGGIFMGKIASSQWLRAGGLAIVVAGGGAKALGLI
jgi:urease accessory protein